VGSQAHLAQGDSLTRQLVRPVDPLAELVERARRGEVPAFENLVRATYADAYALALRLTSDEDDARDVLQEAYLRAFRSIRGFRGDATFSTWLYRITANCSATLLGGRGRFGHQALETLAGSDAEMAFADLRPEHDPEARSFQQADRDRLRAALGCLPPLLRAVVVLRDIYDLPHQAIAAELGISTAAAKVRLHRGRRQLRELLYVASPTVTESGGQATSDGPASRAG
jgi:RNA polymerase sigma-70 factor, ECF subfamily